MLQIKVNDKQFSVDGNIVNDKEVTIDLLDFKDGSFHVLYKQKSYRALLIAHNEEDKEMTLSINGHQYTIGIKDQYDQLLEKLGMNNMATAKVNNIKAPMPGLVLDIKVSVGDTIAKGDAVMVLEAMKMENMIKSPGDGVVKKIGVTKGVAVEKGQVMIELE